MKQGDLLPPNRIRAYSYEKAFQLNARGLMKLDKSLHVSLTVSDEPARYGAAAMGNREEVNISLSVRNCDLSKLRAALMNDRAELSLRSQTTQSGLRAICHDLKEDAEDFSVSIDTIANRFMLQAIWIFSLSTTCLFAGLRYFT